MRRSIALLALLCSRAVLAQETPATSVPVRPGLAVVSAIAGVGRRDYEMVIAVATVGDAGIGLVAHSEADSYGRPKRIVVTRRVARTDIAAAPLQILGFSTEDAASFPGTTALGPSLAAVRELRSAGRTSWGVKNFADKIASTGTLSLVERQPVPFPVLLNGRRVRMPAWHARGILQHPQAGRRPWDVLILDHPVQPLLLKVAYGADGAPVQFKPEWERQVVRIDFPEERNAVEAALASACRVEVPGIYFEFNEATLNPQSDPTLREIAAMLARHADWRLSIEGHTDWIGTDADNLDLSRRRAAAVREALVSRHGVAASRLSTTGYGESRPVERNETPEGRARNRRVELVRPCAGKTVR
jgi:outer membrane protein OmpA-like peptidoglycan-associated protein